MIEAGRTLALRFKEKGEYLRSFVSPGFAVHRHHDERRNHLLCRPRDAATARLLDIAMRHSLTTRGCWCAATARPRTRASSISATGEFLRQTTHQGYRGDSCWSRGLAWGLYGFGTCYGYTRDPRFLATAEACADFYIEHTPADGVPPWDFDAPEESRKLVDTSAAAIAASGLFRLGGMCGPRARRRRTAGRGPWSCA